MTKSEIYLATINGEYSGALPSPNTKIECYLYKIATEGLSSDGSIESGEDGRGISSIDFISSTGGDVSGISGASDTYKISYTDGTSSTFTVKNGADGVSPTIGDNGNWFIGEIDTGVPTGASADSSGGTSTLLGLDTLKNRGLVAPCSAGDILDKMDFGETLICYVAGSEFVDFPTEQGSLFIAMDENKCGLIDFTSQDGTFYKGLREIGNDLVYWKRVSGGGGGDPATTVTIEDLGFEVGVSVIEICESMEVGTTHNISLLFDEFEVVDVPNLDGEFGVLRISRIDETTYYIIAETPTTVYRGEYTDDSEGNHTINWYGTYTLYDRFFYTDIDQLPNALPANCTTYEFIADVLGDYGRAQLIVDHTHIVDLPEQGYLTVAKNPYYPPTATLVGSYGCIFVYNTARMVWNEVPVVGESSLDLISELRQDNNYTEVRPLEDIEDYTRFHFELRADTMDTQEEVCIWTAELEKSFVLEGNWFKGTFFDGNRNPQSINVRYTNDSGEYSFYADVIQCNGYMYPELKIFGVK